MFSSHYICLYLCSLLAKEKKKAGVWLAITLKCYKENSHLFVSWSAKPLQIVDKPTVAFVLVCLQLLQINYTCIHIKRYFMTACVR